MMLRDFQDGCTRWVCQAFGLSKLQDKPERRRRFLEEALELCQSLGMTREEVLRMVEYVYAREAGEPLQELGGTLTTLASLASGHGMDIQDAGAAGLADAWRRLDEIRVKQRSKPV